MTRRVLLPLLATPQLFQSENHKTEKLKEEVKRDFYKNTLTRLQNKYKVLVVNAAADLQLAIEKAAFRNRAATRRQIGTRADKGSRSGVNPYVVFKTEAGVLIIRDAQILKFDVLMNLIDEYAQFGTYFAGHLSFLCSDAAFNLAVDMIRRDCIQMSAEEANIKFAN